MRLNLICGRGLIGVDKGGTSDPYVKIEVGKTKEKSVIIPKVSRANNKLITVDTKS